MTMRWIGCLCALASTACSGDIRLGGTAPDASVDAIASPFAPGMYAASFLDPQMTTCDGALVGHEASFEGITRASIGLVDGAVDFTVGVDRLTIAGTPIQAGFSQPSITLAPTQDPPEELALWDVGVSGSLASGPDATQLGWIGLAVDSGTGHKPTGIEGAYAIVFMASDGTSYCNVMFGALFVSK